MSSITSLLNRPPRRFLFVLKYRDAAPIKLRSRLLIFYGAARLPAKKKDD